MFEIFIGDSDWVRRNPNRRLIMPFGNHATIKIVDRNPRHPLRWNLLFCHIFKNTRLAEVLVVIKMD